jgi:hypothetical protein
MAFAQEQKTKYDEKYSLDNPFHKQAILDFEKEFGRKNFMEILKKKGYFRFNDHYKYGYVDGRYIVQIDDLNHKYKALGKLMERRKYMEKIEKEIPIQSN